MSNIQDTDLSISLNWPTKGESLIDVDADKKPVWGDEKDFKKTILKHIRHYGNTPLKTSDKKENMLIKGNNIYALKYLEKDFSNKIKCVYIDPPFNTGKTFDHYADGLERGLWLSSIKARLEIIKNLLSDDGVVMVHIDDSEMPYLKIIMDEIFAGRSKTSGSKNNTGNYVATIVWQRKVSPQNDAKFFSDVHDYILVYAKNKNQLRLNLIERTETQNDRYKNIDNDSRGVWMSSDLTVKTPSPNYIYEITLPSGRKVSPSKSRSWVVSKEKYQQLLKDNRIWFGSHGNNMPRLKRFLSDVKQGIVPTTLWFRDEVGDNSEAKQELKTILSDDKKVQIFTTPKPERLLLKLLKLATNENDWILDAYLGSGTTCAVAHKLKRKWIGIENGKQLKEICIPRLLKIIEGKDRNVVSEMTKWNKGGDFDLYEIA
jgi:adenine-specific DNA-methyltransferase